MAVVVKENDLPGSVLVLCSHNAVRSPMLKAMLRAAFGLKTFVTSAGVEAQELSPFAVEAMQEIGLDISIHTPRSYEDLDDDSYDLIIALSPAAYELAKKIGEKQTLLIEYWETPEPPDAAEAMSRERFLDAYRRIRDDLILHLRNRFGVDIPKVA